MKPISVTAIAVIKTITTMIHVAKEPEPSGGVSLGLTSLGSLEAGDDVVTGDDVVPEIHVGNSGFHLFSALHVTR